MRDHGCWRSIAFDIVATSFACDTTRVATFMLGNGGSGRSYPFLGVNDAHHEISHHQGDTAKQGKLQTIDTWEVEQLAYLLARLKGIEENGSNVLANSAVFFSSVRIVATAPAGSVTLTVAPCAK